MADEILDTGAAADTTAAIDTTDTTQQLDTTGDITQPGDTTPAPTDYESLFGDEAADTTTAADTTAAVVPPEFQQVLGISEYVKDAQQLTGAVHLADEVLKVQNGQAPISGLLENFRAQNEQAFVKMANTELAPYVEQIFGKKLYSKGEIDALVAGGGEQKTPEQQRIDAIEQRFQQQQQAEQQRQIDGQVRQAQTVLLTTAETALKGTWLEGKGKDLISQIAPHMGMNEEQATRALLSGNTAIVDKAVKALMAVKEVEGKAYAKWKIAESKKLKTTLPAGKGNSRSGEPELEAMTREQRISYLQSN